MSTSAARPAVRTVAISAPAKVNLGLAVLCRRSDGYHEIDSLFVPVDLRDEIRLTVEAGGPDVRLMTDHPGLPRDSGNLAVQAAEMYLAAARSPLRVTIDLEKRIPVGAGLGGGSSDAAAVLRALAYLDGTDAAPSLLAPLALRIGADVAFFLWGCPARVRGIGDSIEPITGLPTLWLAIAWPGIEISTRWAYEELDLALTSNRCLNRMPRFAPDDLSFTEIHNDFEAVVGGRHPQISLLKALLMGAGARAAALSGSGSAVFGLFADGGQAAIAAESVRKAGFWCEAAPSLAGPSQPMELSSKP
ncbi:MAG: 4-diphosphocytidyl-2-C-methyl-D-erythritol kinase [Candidatus Binatota bacterium]|jgi:4-diphosphocytidyl-2-C-methyl-D-erythritol kinase|nr:4-diphosphocytidyl-2-C-methyl-D-erythritol kinase [Candidatus Binatota bacterium]